MVRLSGIRQAGSAANIAERIKRSTGILLKDLPLLSSLYLARIIVWRVLRRRRKERAERRKHFKLVSGAGKASGITFGSSSERETGRKALVSVRTSGHLPVDFNE